MKMKKKTLFRLLFGLIIISAIVEVAICNSQKENQSVMADLALMNIEALASNEGNTKDCPGGYCSRKNSVGESCEACCPTGKNPKCDSFGCCCE